MLETQGYKIVSISESDWSAAKLSVWKCEQLSRTNAALASDAQIIAYWTAQADAAAALLARMEGL